VKHVPEKKNALRIMKDTPFTSNKFLCSRHNGKVQLSLRTPQSCGILRYSSIHSLHRHLIEIGGQFHAPASFTLVKRSLDTHCIGGWVGPTASKDASDKRKISSACW